MVGLQRLFPEPPRTYLCRAAGVRLGWYGNRMASWRKLLDNHLKKIPYKVVIPICIVLLGIYMVDKVYSGKHPNEGKGITDYSGRCIEENIPVLIEAPGIPSVHYRI